MSIIQKPYLIAEIGNNHEGQYMVARDCVKAAADSGAAAVKFQIYDTDFYIADKSSNMYSQLKSFSLTYNQFEKLSSLADNHGVDFIASFFDIKSLNNCFNFCDKLKIASGDNNYYRLVNHALNVDKEVYISTGLATKQEVQTLYDKIKLMRMPETVALLHCVSSYPAELSQINLGSIYYIKEHYDTQIGYSDHTCGITASLYAYIAGANIIEKHFTLSKSFSSFRDHKLSSDPNEFKNLANELQVACSVLGDKTMGLLQQEEINLSSTRRSIYAAHDIKAGKVITESDILYLRPGTGVSASKDNEVIGALASKNIKSRSQINLSDIM